MYHTSSNIINISFSNSNMKTIVVFLGVCVACLARAQKPIPGNPQDATILQFENNNIGVGPYNFAYQTSDGVQRQEIAELKNPGTENEALVVKGSYTYVGVDGVQYTVTYIADENGFQPQGQHLPAQ